MNSSVAIATAAITELTNATARIGVRTMTADDSSVIGDGRTRRGSGASSTAATLVRLCIRDEAIPSGKGSRV
jgi:hypothetical protein